MKTAKMIEGVEISGELHFTSTQVLELFDIKTERLRQWLKKGYFEPKIKATGSGTKNYYSIYQLYAIGAFLKLINLGVQRHISSQIANDFSNEEWSEIISGSSIKYMIISGEGRKSEDWRKYLNRYVSVKPEIVFNEDDDLAVVINVYKIAKEIQRRVT